MATVSSQLKFAEYALQSCGILLLCAFSFWIWRKDEWREWRPSREIAENSLQPSDVIVGAYVFLIMPALIAGMFTGFQPTATTQTSHTSVTPPGELRAIMGLLSGQILSVGFLCVIGWSRFGRSFSSWGLRLNHLSRDFLRAIVLYLVSWPICSLVLQLTQILFLRIPGYVFQEHKTIEVLSTGEGGGLASSLVIVGAILVSPANEELFFRGLLLPALSKATRSSLSAILISGLAFGLIHYNVLHTVPALMVFGVILGYAYAKTKSLTLVVFTHAIFNMKTILWLELTKYG